MNRLESAYTQGMLSVFQTYGINKEAAHKTARIATELHKKAALFNFSDSQEGGFPWAKILLPVLAAAGTGYITYHAGLHGDKNESAFSNIKNYLGRTARSLMRDQRPPAAIDFLRYKN